MDELVLFEQVLHIQNVVYLVLGFHAQPPEAFLLIGQAAAAILKEESLTYSKFKPSSKFKGLPVLYLVFSRTGIIFRLF